MRICHGRVGPTIVWSILLTLPLWSGCDGCRLPGQGDGPPTPAPEPTSDFNFGGTQALPLGNSPGQTGVKPGHWFAASETIRANRADHRGVLRQSIDLRSPRPSADPFDLADPSDDASSLATTQRVPLQSERPVVLPQMRTRRFDARLLAGLPRSINRSTPALLSGQFVSTTQALVADTGQRSATMLMPQEYFFVVLTKRPEKFAALQGADWLRPPREERDDAGVPPTNNYRLVIPKTDGLLTLAESMFEWTSTAVLLWDDLDPAALTAQQSQAIIDWVHFGGRLIINGTGAGIELTRSRFGALMPMEVQGTSELSADWIAELLDRWSVSGDNSTQQQAAIARERSARLFVDGTVHPEASPVRDTAELLLRRAVGSGQVVLSRFELTSDWLVGWRSRDSFFNAAILARPPRRYVTVDDVIQQRSAVETFSPVADALTNTGLRLMSRDGRLAGPPLATQPATTTATASKTAQPTVPTEAKKTSSGEFTSHPISGIGGWRDDSDVATLVLATLRSQAGVVIPPRQFVITALATYLAILVPLNYLFFRVLGRLEWAWVAVPLIGLVGATWIARGASLDVGFARSQTEIALVEMQPGYTRGHATRFISLYNSLSRRYDLAFDSPDAVAAPVGVLGQVQVGQDERRPVTLRSGTGDGPVLASVPVASNRTRIFHVEQMVDLGGDIQLRGDQLRNRSRFELLDVWVVGRDLQGKVEVGQVGNLGAGAQARIRWTIGGTADLPNDLPLDLQRLMRPLLQSETVPPGATRLVARCESPLPGMTIQPDVPQQTSGTVFVVHLTRPAAETPAGDVNLMPDRLEQQRLDRLRDDAQDDGFIEVN